MRIRATRRRSDDTGASLVEFALVLPIVLILALGIINFGYVFGQQLSLNQATREGARKAVVSSTADATQVEAWVRGATGGLIRDTSNVAVTSSTQNQSNGSFTTNFPATGQTCGTNTSFTRLGGQLQVVATYQAKWLVPTYIRLGAPTLKATSVFRCEAI